MSPVDEDRVLHAEEHDAAVVLDDPNELRARARVAEGELEPERFGRVERVGALNERPRREQIRRVDASHDAELVTQRLLEETLLHTTIAPPSVELVSDRLVDALGLGGRRRQERGQRARHDRCQEERR